MFAKLSAEKVEFKNEGNTFQIQAHNKQFNQSGKRE